RAHAASGRLGRQDDLTMGGAALGVTGLPRGNGRDPRSGHRPGRFLRTRAGVRSRAGASPTHAPGAGGGAIRRRALVKIVIFGLTVSSSWGNGHATLWRGLCRALAELGHEVVFFEKDVPYYAAQRDLHELACGKLELYASWTDARRSAERHVA